MYYKERFRQLLQLYISGNISVQKKDELFDNITSNQFDDVIEQYIQQDLKEGHAGANADLPPHVAEEIIRNIFSAERKTAAIIPLQKKSITTWRRVAIAAAIFIFITSGYLFLKNKYTSTSAGYTSLIPTGSITEKNTLDSQKDILLPDGSVVTLKPQSAIHFQKGFNDSSVREVFLEGEAFFKVTKNPSKPFLVYYNNIVTKVLGTSFRINTNPKNGNLEVSVKTGRVQVFENAKLFNEKTTISSVIVTPNQRAIYHVDKELMETALVTNPEPILLNEDTSGNATGEKFNYEQEKLSAVFAQLEHAYGIEIIVENPKTNNCIFTGDVSGQDLFAKLKIICLTTNSSYEINGTRILIKGNGCN